MDITYGEMEDDEWEQCAMLRSSAFGGPTKLDPDWPRLRSGHNLVARTKGAVVGTASAANFGQVFNGITVPMSGVTGVAIAPHAAGNGIAKALMDGLNQGAIERKQPIACLFPATSTLYRSAGYETAGMWAEYAIPLTDVHRRPVDGVTVEPAGPEVFDELRHLHEEQAQRSNGWLVRNDWWWEQLRHTAQQGTGPEAKAHQRILVASRGAKPLAVAMVHHTATSRLAASSYDFRFEDLFGEADGIRSIVATLSSHSTMAGMVQTQLPLSQIDALTRRPEKARAVEQLPWMERIIDVRTALTSRPIGFFEGELHLRISDGQISSNNGDFVLQASPNGQANVESGGRGSIQLHITDLAALYTGYQAASQLAAAGHISGATSQDIANLIRCFAAQQPTLIDFF